MYSHVFLIKKRFLTHCDTSIVHSAIQIGTTQMHRFLFLIHGHIYIDKLYLSAWHRCQVTQTTICNYDPDGKKRSIDADRHQNFPSFSFVHVHKCLKSGDAQTQKQNPQGYFEFCIPREKQFTSILLSLSESLAFQVHLAQWVWPFTYPPGNIGE